LLLLLLKVNLLNKLEHLLFVHFHNILTAYKDYVVANFHARLVSSQTRFYSFNPLVTIINEMINSWTQNDDLCGSSLSILPWWMSPSDGETVTFRSSF